MAGMSVDNWADLSARNLAWMKAEKKVARTAQKWEC